MQRIVHTSSALFHATTYLQEAASQLGRTQADIVAALHRAPLHPALAGLLRTAAAKRAGRDSSSSHSGSVDDLDIVILSDANTVSILLPVFHMITTCCLDNRAYPCDKPGGQSPGSQEFQSTCPVFVH